MIHLNLEEQEEIKLGGSQRVKKEMVVCQQYVKYGLFHLMKKG